jgi:DNA replication protein DnaC
MGKYDSQLSRLAKTSLLIIDDYGLFPMSSPQNEDFHELIAARYEQRSTIMTSNFDCLTFKVCSPDPSHCLG